MLDGRTRGFKNYPKEFIPETLDTNDSYPRYRRRDDGRTVQKHGFTFDNRWVVPHNLYLCVKYDAHINVEVASSIKAVKYLYKYVYKGHDRVTMGVTTIAAPGPAAAGAPAVAVAVDGAGIEAQDEIQQYVDARYVSASEACWRIFGFSQHGDTPSVTHLAVHLPDEHMVTLCDDAPLHEVADTPQKITLTEWFALYVADPTAHGILSCDMPTHFVWNKGTKRWTKRVRHAKLPTIGQVAACSPAQAERFFLRLLLHLVPGAQSFDAVRTHEGTVYATFREAAQARGLLQDDSEWDVCLAEAVTVRSGRGLRHLFADILLANHPAAPHLLWAKYREAMTDDLLRRARLVRPLMSKLTSSHSALTICSVHLPPADEDLFSQDAQDDRRPYSDAIFQEGLREIDDPLQEQGRHLREIPGMPILLAEAAAAEPREIRQEREKMTAPPKHSSWSRTGGA